MSVKNKNDDYLIRFRISPRTAELNAQFKIARNDVKTIDFEKKSQKVRV